MNIFVPIDTDSSIIAVRLKVVAGEATTLNDNATVDDVYIATLVAGAGSAVFTAGATKPTALSEPNLKDIPADGIPFGNYSLSTTEDDITGAHSWDVVNSNIAVDNEDLYILIGEKMDKVEFPTEDAIIIQDSDGNASNSFITIETSIVGEPTESDLKLPTSKLIRNWYASLDAGYGSSQIGVRDTAGNFTGNDVESVLAELGAGIAASIIDLTSKTCSMLATYYSNLGRVRATTPPITDGSGNAGIGTYRFQYVFKNAVVATPSTGITWASEATEISRPENYMEAIVPDPGDALYSGGTAGNAYFYCRVRFENNSPVDNVTDWAYLDPGVAIAEPQTLGEALVEGLAEGSSNSQKTIDLVNAYLANNPTFASLKESSQELVTEGSAAPTTTPTDINQVFLVTSGTDTGDVYRVSKSGTTLSWYLAYNATP